MEDKKPVSSDKWTEALYETLKLNNAYDKDYDTFYNDFYAPGIKGYTYRKDVYDDMTSHGLDLGATYEDFASKIGLHAIDPQTQQTPMGADSISKDMTPVEVTPTKKPEAKKEEKPEVSAEAVSENQHPTDTLQDFNPNVSRMRNAGTNYFLQAAEEISNNAYSYGYQPKSLEELANQAAKDLKKKAYQKPKEDSYVRLNQTARYIPIRSLPKDADLDSVFAAAANFEHMVCGDTKEYTFAPLGGDIQERYEKWKALNINNPGNRYTQETASMSPDAVYIQAKNLKALGYERPAWISELRWNEALTLKDEDYGRITARLQQEDQPRRLKLSNGAYSDSVSLKGMYHENITPTIAEGIYYKGSINTTFVLFQDGRIRPLQAPDPSVLRGGWEAQRELFRRQYEKMTFGEEGKDYTDPYEKNRVVGNFLQNGEVCHIIYFPYMIEQRRWDDAQELIKIGLGGKFNEEGMLLNPDDRLQIVPVVVKNGESEEDAIAKAKVELDNEISKKLPYKETYLQQQIAQAREALKKEQERLKQLGKHDAVKGSYLPPMFNSKYYDDLLESSTEEGVKRSDEVALARGNIRKLEESIKKYTQALEALRTGDKVGAWGGFLEGISDLDNWTFGLYNLRENLVAVKAHEGKMGQEAKDRLGLARSLSQESMSAFHRHGEGRFYGPAFGAGYSFPFTIGAIATYGAGNVAARGIIRGGSRMAAKYGTNWLFDTTIRATTRLAAINAAGVIDSSFQMPRIISDAAIEKMGLMNYTFDENQRIVVTGTQQEKNWGHSLLHSGLNTLVQNVSERVGTYVLEPVAKAFGIGKISLRSFGEALPYNKTIHMIQNGAFAKAMSKVYGTFEKGGYDGFVNEVLEEYIANPMTATFDENYTFADIFDSRQNLDTALSVWASSIFMLGFSSTASSVKYYRTLRSVNSAYDKAEANARRLFGNENWDKIQNTILRLEGEPLVNAIYAGVCQNKSLSDEQKKAFLNYVRAQKAQAVFNNAVSEKYSFSLTGEELNEMNAMTIHAYAEGRNMQTPQEYAQAQQAFADTREMAMSALGVTDDIDAYLDTLGETPAEQLKKGVEAAKENGLDEKAANAALSAYLNAREQQKGAMDGITSDESIRRQHADSVIRQITFENEADSEGGSGKVILVNVKGREKPVFLVRGRYENGSITGETVVVSEGNGVIEMIPASEVEGIVEESDAMTERQRKYDKIDAENKEQQRLINLNMDTPLAGQGGILMDEEGHRRQVGIKCVFNDEQGNPASVLVVDQNNNDYLIPIDVFREQRGRGRKFEAIEPYLDETDEEYHAAEGLMNEEYNLANKEQEGVSEEDAQGAAEGVTPQPATDATEKPTKPEVKYDYHVKMKDGSGNAVSGRVTNLSADGVEIEFDAPYNGKMVDRIPLADFDNGVSEIADANGNVLWNETEAVGDTEVAPQVDATPTQVGQEDAEKSAIAQAEQEHKPTALERIPRSENGEPLFEQAENPEVAWDALVEFSDGNAATAKEIADAMTEEKRKALEKARKLKLKGKTPAEMLASKQANAAELAKAESEYNHWQRMANVEQNRQNAIRAQQEAEERQRATERAEAEKAEREAREEAERREREALEGIPEWHMDTPKNARKRGARRYGGQIFTRQEPVNGVVGKEVEVKFSQKDLPKGHVVVMEAEQLQPSHIQGKRNPMFFIEEAQPKNRAEDVSQTAARNIAENIRPQEITSSTTAYTGAPTINTRGEVIQGNNRSDALRYLWQNNLPKQQQAYKQYLLDQAEQLGLDSNAINAMQHPVLVNQLDVDDAEAIRLGQMTAQDTESGGVERIKPKNVAQKLGDNMRTFANRLLSSSDNDATFGQLVDRNGEDVLNWMNQIGAISNTQYQSAFDSKGKLTPEAKNDLQKVLYQAVFKGGSQQLEEMFDRLPAKAQRAILSTAFRDMDSPFAGKMLSEIQSSIIAYNALMQDEGFASAKNMEEVLRAIEIFKHQTALDDRFEQYMPADNFSNFALHLAGLYKASDMSQTTIASYFNEMYDLAQGKKAATLFEEADTTEYPLAEVIKKVLGIDYKPAKNGNNNVANGGADVALRNQESQGRQPRSNKPSASGEQNQTGTESSERGEGVGVSDNEQGRQVDIEVNAPRKGDLAEAQENRPKNSTQAAVENKESKPVRFEAGRRLTKEEKKEVLNTLRDAFKENGVPYHIEESDFGKERRVYEPTSEDWVKSDITGRPLRYYITLPDGRVAHPTELFPNISAREVTGHVNRMALLEKEASELISKQLNGFPSEYIPTAISILEKMQSLPHDVRDMGYGPYFLVSYDYIFNGKHYGNSPLFVSLFAHSVVKESSDAIEATVKVVNNSYYMVDALLSALKNKYNSTQSAIESASAEVETSPTEAQKKAGNYKMGHVKVGAFDVTIENPKGSERSGTDANGKKWSVKMNNTYGYIRGTEGVDGDHIDVFLAEDMDKWDGKYAFVVDQYNPDGTFDEHKVMLGFNSMEEARSAYLSNYEKGWENGRRIVVARIKTDDFQKWVDSSHRKTKPFAHYVIAGAADVSDNEKKPSASKKGKPRVSKEDEVKRTVEHFPMETPEEAAAFDKRIPEMEDSELLAYMQEDGKGDANKAYHMNIYDEYDYRHTDEQTEAYDIYIQQLHDSNTTLEQAEEMLGNILGDVERFATDERSQLIGQSDALQDYITELERQKEDKRAEAENSAENTDANHVEEADVEENKSAEPVEADKSKQYGEYQEVYDNFVSDVENRGMIPDLRAIKNKIRDTKRRLTVLRNGAATSIQSDEDLKRFETAEKKLTDLLHVYEAMRDYTEARIKKAEAAAQRKPWSEKNAQERMDEASKNPLTEEEIQNAPTDEVNKANALDYLSGNHGLIQSISYLKVYEDVRNPNGSAASDSGTKDKTQLAGRSNSASEGRDTGGKSGGTAGRVDNGGSRENVSEQSDGGKSGERSTRDNAGEGSNTGISTEEQPVGRRDANSGKPRRGGTSGRTRSDGGRSGRGESGNPATENGTRRAASESVKEESADDFLNQALGEFKDVLDDFIKAGRGELSISLVGLNSKQMEILPRLIQVGAKVGYAYIRKGVHGFTEWANYVKEAIGKYLRDANLSDDEIDAFIKEMWKSKIPFDGQIHTLEEWASIYSKKDLRNKVRTTIEEKREAQRQAESISVKTGDINNIRETLPFLLPQQQEDVLRAETQFFDKSHQDREHANGKGYMFTNGTGTGKTYTGLGIVKRFVKQGKKRILILTPSQPKVHDWINDGKNLGLEIKSLDDWAKERGTTATTEAGEGTIITTYANFRQNEELLNGTFDLIVYDESHRLMENKNAANTIGTDQHHMIANRDVSQATVRLRKINPIYQELNKVHEEFKAKRENLVKKFKKEDPLASEGLLASQGLIPYSFNVDNWNEKDAERFPEFAKLRKRFLELREVIVKEVDPQIEEQAKKDAAHTKVVFLSATPFNTRENIDYAQGYIFSYPDKEQARGYSVASPQTIFFEEHFGAAYKWRYGRLEHSERNAEAIAQQEREFSDWLQHTLCTMSGRIIDSEYDYSRDFPVVSVEHAEEINNAAEEILRDKYFNMAYHKVFGNYNYAGALFETLKVATLIPRIKQHLEAGRKVVIFHRRVESKTPLIPPFAAMLSACHAIIDGMKMENKPKEKIDAARHRLEELKEKWRGLLMWESMLDYSMPREQIAKAFGADNVLYFSGQESTKAKNQAVDSFNNDESGKNIIVIQEASGKEGISLHDTTGKHQRVLITLALPQSPITALQIEGRIYRIGNRSNAIFEYPLLGLNSEIILFGQKFNGQIGTTENLALGSQARNLRESFARSVEESGKDVPIEEQGFGGKEADAAERDETSPFDRAVLDYYGNQKLKGKRDSREGVDYYPTPEPLGFKMVEWGNLNDGETALEPSAGHGAIARYVPSANPLTAIEPSQNLFAKLQLKAGGSGRKFVNTIFEGYNVVNKHDVIFMNPPFGTGGRLAVDHVAKAFTHLTEGGRIVAIIPRGSTDKKFDKWIDEQENAVVTGEIMLPDITFQQAGTSVMARVLVIDKVTNQKLRDKAESKYRRVDLSRRQYDKIEDFFEDIRDIQMPSRTIDEKARMLKRAAPALRDIKELKGVVDVQAQDDGIDIRTKGSAMGFYLDLTVSDFSLQQQLRTKYQRYAQEIEWNEHRHNEKAVEIYKAYNDLVCRLLGKTAEEVESDITREKMGLEQPHEEQEAAINVAPQVEESPSSEQNGSTTESSPYHYELKHHTKTGAEMFMAMPNEKSGLSSEEYSSMLAKAKKHGGYWNRFMKGFAFPSEKSAKDFLAETGNTEQKPSRGNLYRQGEELSPNHEIRIVEGDENHGFKNYKEAKSWAKSNIARTYSNEETGGKGEIRISNAAIDKYLSESAIEKSDSKDVHMAVLRVLPDVIRESVDAEQHADYLKGKDGVRSIANGINPDVTIHRLYGAVSIGDKTYRVKVTLKEDLQNEFLPKKAYSYEATKIELLAGTLGKPEDDAPRTNNSITAANLLKGVEKSYGAGRFFENYSEESSAKTQAAQKATENLNLGGNVVVHESAEGLEGKEATAKGWYDTRTGQIHVVLSNNADAADVTQTILHESVAHHGLRELFGHNVMDAFLDSIFAAASQEVKDAINELRRGNGWNFRTATEEYLAGLAERTDFERMTAEERGLFATIRRLFNRALEFLGLKNHELSDRELAYILWCSYQNLKTGEKGRYVAEAERIAMRYKLKAGKNAMTDTEKKESAVLLRGKLDNLQEILAKDTYEKLVTSGSHLERTAWVDMLSPLQDLQHAIEKNGGFKLEDFENPYNAYVTMSSRNYAQMDIYKRTLYADMIEAIHALGSETGRSYEEIKMYVMAKHGMERQKYMAGKAAEEAYDRYKSMHPFGQKTLDYFIDEYEEKSFAGLTELFGTQSVSDAMDEAQKYVDEVEAEAGSLADSLWDSIRAATKSSLQRAYEAGLISKETYDNVSSMYQYYIPLRGFDETTSDEVYEYFGDQTINGGTGSFMKKAKGRKSVADDPFAVIGNMAEMAIMQSNRNLMKQQLLNLALNHPSDLVSVSDLYVKFDEDYDNGDGTRGAWVPVAVPDTSGMTTEEANQVMLDFQDDMEEKVKGEPDTYALAHQKPHIPYRVLGRNMNEHQIMVKRGGKTYILTINGNPRAAQAINGLLNPDATENPGAIALKAMTNWIARMATARNVEFAISNAMRDLEFSTTLIPKEGTEYYGRYVKNYLTCIKNIGRLVNRLNGNTLDMSNPLEKAFYDFIYNGGETGYTFMKGVERYKGEITKALSELRAKEGKSKIERLGNKVVYGHHYIINDAWNIYMKGAEYLSRCTEDWVRFAVFLTSRQSGRSMEQSIMDAKEATVNFDRKGAGSKSAGKWDVSNFFSMNNLHFLSAYAASAFKNFYAFSNASIQGLDKNVRLHLNHTAGMLMWDGAAVALGMLSAMCIPLMLSAIGGDPDDYWDMPESMRRMGIMLPLGKDGRFLTLPMSIEHRAAYGIGELLGTVVCGSENLPASEISFQAFEQLSQILPLDLTEGNGSMLSLVPTAVRPEVEIAFNKNWLGMPIYKEPFNKNTPAFRNVYQSTNPNYIAMSKWLNEVQGGGDYERAGVQVNPAMVQHLVESYTGGAGKFVSRTSGVISKIIQGEQIRSNEIPFYRTLVKSVDDRTHNRAARERFQREYDKGQKLIYKIDNYQKESARGNSQYVKELDEFAKSKDFMSYMLWKSYNSVKSQFDNARSYIGDDKDKRAALDHAQILVQKMMTECARAVEDSKTQEEADKKIGRIQSEYTPQIKETLSKVEE